MVNYINPACFITNVFAACGSQSQHDVVQLRKIRDYVMMDLSDKNIFIEWTRAAFMHDIALYKDFIGFGDDAEKYVVWKSQESPIAVVQGFNAEFNPSLITSLHKAIKEKYASILILK